MICLESFLKKSLQDVLKTSWTRLQNVLNKSWRCLEDVLKTFLQDILKTTWRRFKDVLARRLEASWKRLENVWRMSWKHMSNTIIWSSSRRLEDVWVRKIFSSWSRRLQDVLKTSSEDEDKCFIKTNVCWVKPVTYKLGH